MLSRFLKWWFSELSTLFGSGANTAGRDRGEYLRLSLEGQQVRVEHQSRGRRRPLAELAVDGSGRLSGLPGTVAAIDPAHTRCRVVLQAEKSLSRELELPLVAEENLSDVLRFEMDRQTPFRAGDVYFDYQILKRDPARQKLQVLLQVVRRPLVDNLITHLEHWDLRPVHSRAPVGTQGELVLDFQPGIFQEPSSFGFNLLLTAMALVLAVVAVVLPVQEQRQLSALLEIRLDGARLAAAKAVKVRDLLDARIEAGAILKQAKSTRPSMVELLETLSQALPDDTYLFRLDVRDADVSLHGSSKSASALIGILEQTPYLAKTRFASPVTREGKGGRERFHIGARLLQRQSDAAAHSAGSSS